MERRKFVAVILGAFIAVMLGAFLFVIQHHSHAQTSPETFSSVPTFNCVGLYWSPSGGGSAVEAAVRYRRKGDAVWMNAQSLVYCAAESDRPTEYRGSIVGLKQGTTYEVELDLSGPAPPERYEFTTWSERFPIASVITVADQNTPLELVNLQGSPSGYILVTGPATIDVAYQDDYNVRVSNCRYLIIRGLTLKRARRNGILLGHSISSNSDLVTDIVIENNDISGWGTVHPSAPSGTNWGDDDESGIRSSSSNLERIVIQRNKIHHPRTDSNSWKEPNPIINNSEHPNGPQGITFENGTKGNHVIRFNEIYSDDDHRFNDGMGSDANFGYGGFPISDSDIYSNIVTHTWDDAIEVEGANRNVRVFGNYTDETYTGVAMAGVTMGPLYVFRNVFQHSRTGPSHFYGGTAFKRGGKAPYTSDGPIFIYNNTMYFSTNPTFQGGIANRNDTDFARNTTARNNILRVRGNTGDRSIYDQATDAAYSNNLCNGDIVTQDPADQSRNVRGTPTYVSGAGIDRTTNKGVFQLQPGSLGFDGGFTIPNFADDYSGSAPDIGAHEAGQPPLEFGVNAYVRVNEAPVVVADGYRTQRATVLTVPAPGVLANDGDPDGDSLAAELVSNVSHGMLALNGDGSFSYSPDVGFSGTDSFAYRASDGELESSVATVTIAVGDLSPYVQEPGPQGIVSLEAERYHVNSPSVDHAWALRNDTSGHSGIGFMRAEPDVGVILNSGFAATSPRLDYRVIFRRTGRYYLWVRKYSTGGFDDSCHVGLNGAASPTSDRIDAFSNPNLWAWTNKTLDGPLATIDVTATGENVINVWMREGGFRVDKIVLTLDPGFVPVGAGPEPSQSASANQAPVAVGDSYSIGAGQSLNVAAPGVLANDTDAENDPLNAQMVAAVSNGTVTLNADGSFVYTPNVGFVGADTFTYRAGDGVTYSNSATVTINVTSPPPYIQAPGPQGIVSIEAERFHFRSATSTHSWDFFTDVTGFSGAGFMRAAPDIGANNNTGYVTSSPSLRYRVRLRVGGTYYVWIRKYSTGGLDDSCHVGINGTATSTSDRIDAFSDPNRWAWTNGTLDGPRATIQITAAGEVEIDLWMREDGFRVDKIVLTTDPNFIPSSLGPEPSPQG